MTILAEFCRCGGTPIVRDVGDIFGGSDHWSVKCQRCPERVSTNKGRNATVFAWNRSFTLLDTKSAAEPGPCPFCEHRSTRVVGAAKAWRVMCDACLTMGPVFESRERAIELWNAAPRRNL